MTVILNGLPWKWIEINLSFLRLCWSTAFQTLVDYDGYSISSKGLLPTVVDIIDIYLINHSSFQREGHSFVTSRTTETHYKTSTGQVKGMQTLQVPWSLSVAQPLNHCYKTPHQPPNPPQVGTHSFGGLSPLCPYCLAKHWSYSFLFHPKLCLHDLIQH